MKVKNKIFIIFLFIVYIAGSISGVYFMSEYSSEFQKYKEYYNPVITGIGFILGLIVVVTIFYLGKSHDYYKSILEISNKNNIDFDSYNDSFNTAEKEFEKFSETSEKIFKSIKEHDREDIEKFVSISLFEVYFCLFVHSYNYQHDIYENKLRFASKIQLKRARKNIF